MKRSMKKLALGLLVGVLSITGCMPAFAGTWKSDSNGWWYQKDDGTWYNNGWQWVDGNNDGVSQCYYFTNSGYILTNTTTPDGYQVNADGAWIENNVVKTQGTASEQTNTSQKVLHYTYKTDFVKHKFADLLNNDEENMFRVMGQRPAASDFFGTKMYLFVNDEISFWCYTLNGKVVKIEGIKFWLLNIPDYTTYSLEQVDKAMGGGGFYDSNGNVVWKISDEYPLYAMLERDRTTGQFDHASLFYYDANNNYLNP